MLDHLEVFFGDANPAEARVYARLPSAGAAGLRLSGLVTGPFCAYAKTLPARIRLEPLVGETPLAQAIVPDPCFWSPQMPFQYEVTATVHHGEELLGTITRWLGIRPLGVRGRRLHFEGKPWVLRGISTRTSGERALDDWHRIEAAMFVEHPDRELCLEASRLGVLLVAHLGGTVQCVSQDLARCAESAAVGVAVLDPQAPLDSAVRETARNVLLAQRFGPEQPIDPEPWAQAAIVEVGTLEGFVKRAAAAALPIIAYRPAAMGLTLEAARAQCDVLQRDLAGRGDFAGYIV